jgi:RimJ/RimL family protein N-acetyltransferase
MDISTSLYRGKFIRLSPIDHENDAEIESRWTHDPEYLRLLGPAPARPLSPAHVRKKYDAIEKEVEEDKNLFYFAVRTLAQEDGQGSDRLVGFARLYWIEWNNGSGNLELGIGNREDRNRGFGCDALNLLLRFAFAELNLFRLTAVIPEYNAPALHLFRKFGFVDEIRRREAIYRDGRRWDLLNLGLLREEWRPGEH